MAFPLSQEKPSVPSLLSALASNQADSSKEGSVYCPPYCPPKTEADASVGADSRPERTVTGKECASGRRYPGKGGVRNILRRDVGTGFSLKFSIFSFVCKFPVISCPICLSCPNCSCCLSESDKSSINLVLCIII